MITKAQAIKAINPNAEFVIRGGVVESVSEGITDEQIATKQAELQAEYDSQEYSRARAEAYAPIADQLDMQYWDSVNGSRTWLDHIEAVKEAHPK